MSNPFTGGFGYQAGKQFADSFEKGMSSGGNLLVSLASMKATQSQNKQLQYSTLQKDITDLSTQYQTARDKKQYGLMETLRSQIQSKQNQLNSLFSDIPQVQNPGPLKRGVTRLKDVFTVDDLNPANQDNNSDVAGLGAPPPNGAPDFTNPDNSDIDALQAEDARNEEAAKSAFEQSLGALPKGLLAQAKPVQDLVTSGKLTYKEGLEKLPKVESLSDDERRAFNELSQFERDIVGLYKGYKPGVVGAGKYFGRKETLFGLGPSLEIPGSIEEGEKNKSLKQQGKLGGLKELWNKGVLNIQDPTADELSYKDQYDQTVQSLANVFAKGDKGQGEQVKANAREWLANPNSTDPTYRHAAKGDIEDARALIKETKDRIGYKKDISEFGELGKSLENFDVSQFDVSTPAKANKVLKSMVSQGVDYNKAKQVISNEARRQIKLQENPHLKPLVDFIMGKGNSTKTQTKSKIKPFPKKVNIGEKGGAEVIVPQSMSKAKSKAGYAPVRTRPGEPIEQLDSQITPTGKGTMNHIQQLQKTKGMKSQASPGEMKDAQYISQVAQTRGGNPASVASLARAISRNPSLVTTSMMDNLSIEGAQMLDAALAMLENEGMANVA